MRLFKRNKAGDKKAQEVLTAKLEDTARQLKIQSQTLTKRTYQTESLFQMNRQLQSLDTLDEMYNYLIDVPAEMLGANQSIFLSFEEGRLFCKGLKGLDLSLKGSSIDFKPECIAFLSEHNGLIRISDIKEKLFFGKHFCNSGQKNVLIPDALKPFTLVPEKIGLGEERKFSFHQPRNKNHFLFPLP